MNPYTILTFTFSLIILIVVIFFVIKGATTKSKILCKKNEWTTIINNFGTGYAKTWNISFKTETGEPVKGKFIEKRYVWILPGKLTEGELQENMQFHRNWINAIYKLKIYSETDIVVEIKSA